MGTRAFMLFNMCLNTYTDNARPGAFVCVGGGGGEGGRGEGRGGAGEEGGVCAPT